MGLLSKLAKATAGTAVGVGLVTALPVFGAVGGITATGTAVGSVAGAVAGFFDD